MAARRESLSFIFWEYNLFYPDASSLGSINVLLPHHSIMQPTTTLARHCRTPDTILSRLIMHRAQRRRVVLMLPDNELLEIRGLSLACRPGSGSGCCGRWAALSTAGVDLS